MASADFERIFDEVLRVDEQCPQCRLWRLRKRTPAGGSSSVWKCLAPACTYVTVCNPNVRY